MKILLFYPACLEKRIHTEDIETVPIGLYFIASVLKSAGHQVEIVNGNLLGGDTSAIRDLLYRTRPQVLGVSILNANRWGGIEAARIAKCMDLKIVTVFGGVGATFLWNHLLTHFSEIDYVVVGEGERTVLTLIDHLGSDHRIGEIADIPGVALRHKGLIRYHPGVPQADDLDTLPDPSEYFTYNHLILTRGCGGNCRFCGSPAIWGRKIRSHSPEYFVRQLERLHKRGVNFFFVSDDTFTFNKKAVMAVCRLLIEKALPITWAAISRVDFVDGEILSWMRRAGCIQISYGVESGSKQIRKYLKKNIREEQIQKAFQLTSRWGILSRAYFIYGCPGESDETIAQTLALIAVIKPLAAIFYILDLFPGTAIYEEFKEKSGATDDIWMAPVEDIMYFETDPQLTQDQVREFGRRLRDGFHKMLPEFATAVELEDDPDLYPLHADFLSRLGLTFSHGDYSEGKVPHAMKTAEQLFRRAIDYHPNARAFLGLGMLKQRQRDFHGAIHYLSEGANSFPQDEQIQTCLGICLMSTGNYKAALKTLLPFTSNVAVHPYISACYRALGDVTPAENDKKKQH